ncbi:MAG TPA: UvrD-helicase domain-containing protein [Opitutaceae bacterium]|nr:UvrD-helicase domain-containing protein [Opitutaceae bacterium]
MAERPTDFVARERFRDEWTRNFAVSANAGSGKTTAISERLAAMALAPAGAEPLSRTAVVTFTKKAAAQIGRRAREVLLRRLAEQGRADLAPLDALERAFFGTIHSFCLLLAQRHGQSLGLHLDPEVLDEAQTDALWQAFLEQAAMQFQALPTESVTALLRHLALDEIFPLARTLDSATAQRLLARPPEGGPPAPDEAALRAILAAQAKQKSSAETLARNQAAAREWRRRFAEEHGFLPLPEPEGSAANIRELYANFFAPLKSWLARAAAVLAAELAERFRVFRFERGVQTYADQIDAAVAVLRDPVALERIRADGWRVILDEAQDTDAQQFEVLVEITRPPGAAAGTWPEGGGPPPRPGHFCLVGDAQQSIYSGRVDLRNFQKHLAAFARRDGGEQLVFDVTFRLPAQIAALLNRTLPAAFSGDRAHNLGLPPAEGAPAPLLQVPFTPLAASPGNPEGAWGVLLLSVPERSGVDAWQMEEARQLAAWLRDHGPAGVGARTWSEVCVLAPRNDWLLAARDEFKVAGLKTALQLRRNRNGDQPVYAWLAGLLMALCDPLNTFEWVGVLRELFAVSDAQLAEALAEEKIFHWNEPERYAEPLGGALLRLRPLVMQVDEEGLPLEQFARTLAETCGLAAKAWAVDPTGAAATELERLLAKAAETGLAGGGPRRWRAELLREIDLDRPAGKAADDAINLLTVHSAKGLEWPAVILLGLWRGIGRPPEQGLQLVTDAAEGPRVFFDGASLPPATAASRDRERLRENTRLLYVGLTRARRTLLLPWAAGFGGRQREPSLADLWGAELGKLPPLEIAPAESRREMARETPPASPPPAASGRRRPDFPARLLPHQLSQAPDAIRTARHEATFDEPLPPRAGNDPIDYGLWWHETMEFWPWGGEEAERAAYGARALAQAAAQGLGPRAGEELAKFSASALSRELGEARWTRLTELSLFAPLRADAWIDGVVDLVAHDPATRRIVAVDWKTNHRRPGEENEQLLARLAAEYAPQLQAYGACLQEFFPGCVVELRLYATAAAEWRAVGN